MVSSTRLPPRKLFQTDPVMEVLDSWRPYLGVAEPQPADAAAARAQGKSCLEGLANCR